MARGGTRRKRGEGRAPRPARPQGGPWWAAGGEERCVHCAHAYVYEVEVRCVACDGPMCPLCRVEVRAQVLCPPCCEAPEEG